MIFASPIEEAKFHRVMIVDSLGFCYIIVPYGRALGSNPEAAEYLFRNKYWATYLLNDHSNRWGYRFDLRSLYLQFFYCPLIHHKSDHELIDELSDRMACGELLVYRVDNMLRPPPDIHAIGVPLSSPARPAQHLANADNRARQPLIAENKPLPGYGEQAPIDATVVAPIPEMAALGTKS